ncbi:MarR family winged helix-turn-helix transcriptional regulator [Hydrogenophaga sp. NFH-34]|uniref:MarR family winged helix-turn-helix transcriptional regulator n=1 Tax=Hydrogenophaga sp. NFH-34 TaxID=2744446 RepID=UPI001F184AEC|nr:MarR family transcriptional regulator [Hydrogenophaga sp. NFH-34]
MTRHASIDTPLQQNDLFLYRLYRIHATASPLVVRMCERDYGITRREWRVLSCLAAVEGVQSSELAQRAMLDRARTSRAITSLVDKGLLRREPRPSDRREVHVFLTERGRALHGEVFPRIVALQRELLAPFSEAERQQFSALLERLQDSASRLNPGDEPLPPLDD